jgi:hypothetical protein
MTSSAADYEAARRSSLSTVLTATRRRRVVAWHTAEICVDRLPDRGIERSDPLGHLDPERRRIVQDLERCPQPHDVPEVVSSQVGAFQLLQPQTLANGCNPHPNKARICSAVTGSPVLRPSIPSNPEPVHTPGGSPRSV